MLTGQPRTASVQAATDIAVYVLSKTSLYNLMKKHHSLSIYFNEILAARLSSTNAGLSGEKNRETAKDTLASGQFLAGNIIYRRQQPAKRLNKTRISIAVAGAVICVISTCLFLLNGLSKPHIIFIELLLAATFCWGLNILSFHVVSLSLPVLAVLLGVTTTETAFSGFSNSSWYLLLGVLAISASISKTGLLFRLALLLLRKFPPSYIGQTLAFALTGLILTPVIPSNNCRAALASPLARNLGKALNLKNYSPGTVGLAMSCLLGFGQMSFMFLNGSSSNLLVLGLLPGEISSQITWGYWLKAALPIGALFFLLSYLFIILFYRPQGKIQLNPAVIESQIKILGHITMQEKISLMTVVITILAFLTQPWHNINTAWIAMLAFLILCGCSIMDEKSVRSDIDWNYLIAFGSLTGLGNIMSSIGLTAVIADKVEPYLNITGNKILLLLFITIVFYLIRFALPAAPAQIITMIMFMPLTSVTGINPFIIGLIVILCSNPWFLPHQSTVYQNVVNGTEGKSFRHEQVLKLAFAHFVITIFVIIVTFPYWQNIGLIR
ncbi:MAG: Inner membrane protein YbhI [Pelotomaculum sp. PtaB.Bin013]|nr:MAG: Inner membrane protein YbhI [Pelotomaculum sp. PtaB.Bin013]